MELIRGDCLEWMESIQKKSVDLILVDPPYGTTYCKWDIIIPLEEMWKQSKRLLKEKGTMCVFGVEPFSSLLRTSNMRMFKYDWYWEKNKCANFGAAKYNPLNYYETISVFYNKCRYFPQMIKREGRIRDRRKGSTIGKNVNPSLTSSSAMNHGYADDYDPTLAYPKKILKFNIETGLHETQKPVPLLEYLIKTYTLEGDTVLDFAMGSGSTGRACQNLRRNFIGMENDDEIFEVARRRLL